MRIFSLALSVLAVKRELFTNLASASAILAEFSPFFSGVLVLSLQL